MNNLDEIKKNALEHEKHFSKNATFSKDAIKIKEEEKDIRSCFEHDIDRIVHSHAYTRYINKTQVYSNVDNDNISRRMTHVQFVSRASRTIARALKLNEDLCEAIALGHDIGHVPYGHEGEYILDRISYEALGEHFAHNVQSVRELLIVENNGNGLNLTIQTLDGILTHNGEFLQDKYYPKKKTKEQFFEEYNNCYKDSSFIKTLRPMTLEGCIVRISDIIGYIGKDIEDAIMLGMIDFKDIPEDIVEVLGKTNKEIMNNIICDIIENSYGKDYICMSDIVFSKIKALKKFNYDNIYIKSLSDNQRKMLEEKFRTLYNYYFKALEKNDRKNLIFKNFLNNMSNDYIKNNKNERIVIDYIAGMTDKYFESEYIKATKE